MNGRSGSSHDEASGGLVAALIWLAPPPLAIAAALYATSTGVGLSTDSSAYIGAARGLLEGAGVAQRSPQGTMQPMTYYAPLLPALIAAVARFGLDPLAAARWLNAIAAGLNVALAMGLIRSDTGSRRWAAFGGVLLAVSLPFLKPHSIAWTEPIFFLCSLAMIGALARYAASGDRWALLGAALAAGLGGLVRYAGNELLLAGVLVMVLTGGRRHWARTVGDVALFVIVGAALPAVWTARNWLVEQKLWRYALAWHPPPWSRWWSFLGTWGWFLGLRGGWISRALAVGGFALLISLARGQRRRLTVLLADLTPFSRTALIFAAVHLAFIIGSAALVHASLEFDARLFGPAYVWGAVGALCVLARWSQGHSWTPPHRALLATGLAAFAAAHLVTTIPWLVDAHRNGQYYTRPEWRLSELMQRIKHVPATAAIYADGSAAIDLLLDRPVHRLPERIIPMSGQPNPRYELELEHMRGRLAASQGVVVYFSTITWMEHVVRGDELTRRFGLRVLYHGADGVMYGWPPQAEPEAAAQTLRAPNGGD